MYISFRKYLNKLLLISAAMLCSLFFVCICRADGNNVRLTAGTAEELSQALEQCTDKDSTYVIKITDNISLDGLVINIPEDVDVEISSANDSLYYLHFISAVKGTDPARSFIHVYGNLTLQDIGVDAGGFGRCITIEKNGSVELGSNCTAANGYVNTEISTDKLSSCGGGVLVNGGTLYLRGGSINGCTAALGGGIYLNGGKAVIKSGTISGNSAESGEIVSNGIYVCHTGTSGTGESVIEIGGSPSVRDKIYLENESFVTIGETLGNIKLYLELQETAIGRTVAKYSSASIATAADADRFVLGDNSGCAFDKTEKVIAVETISLKNCTVKAVKTQYTYTGKGIIPDVTVNLPDGSSADGYVLYAQDNINAGTVKATISGDGLSLTGEASFNFVINKLQLTTSMITLANTSYTYNGTAVKPAVSVGSGDLHFTEGRDYSVAYFNNAAAGTATVRVTALDGGNLTGYAQKTFTIIGSSSGGSSSGGSSGVSSSYSGSSGHTISGGGSTGKLGQSVAVTEKTINKYVNDPGFALNASTSGYGILTYSSSDESVVTVSKTGRVTIKGSGYADVTITASETSKYAAAIQVVRINVRPVSQNFRYSGLTSSGNIMLAWDQDTDVSGYQIRYAYDENMDDAVTKTVSEWKRNYIVIDELEAGKTCYIEIRGYKLVGDTQIICGDWSEPVSMEVN